jgi:hypothetical protein
MASLVDIKAFHFLPDGRVVQSLADETTSGELVSGATKLAQKFFITLMTQRGSVPYLPKQGTIFFNRFSVGLFSSDADVFVNFAAATVDLGPQLRNEQTIDDPPEEQYVRSAVEQVFISPELVDMRVRVVNKLADGIVFLVPLEFQTR